jgi:GNAT superfamily N-acetyltransferase
MFPLNPEIARLLVGERTADEYRAAEHYRRMAEAKKARRQRRRSATPQVPRQRASGTVSGGDIRVVEARASYRHALLAFLRQLSSRTAYSRFLTRAMPEDVADVDLMLARDPCHRAVLALRGEEIVGHAQAAGSPGLDAVEIGVVVADEWQGRGIGTLLVRALLDEGPAATAGELDAFVLAWNTRARRLLTDLWPDAVVERDGELLHYRMFRAPAAEPRVLTRVGGCQA